MAAAIYKPDPLAKARAKLFELAVRWKRAMSDQRCGNCGVRTNRSPEEVALAEQVGILERLSARHSGRFDSEAPTRRRSIVK
jgi:hypothetical protein